MRPIELVNTGFVTKLLQIVQPVSKHVKVSDVDTSFKACHPELCAVVWKKTAALGLGDLLVQG